MLMTEEERGCGDSRLRLSSEASRRLQRIAHQNYPGSDYEDLLGQSRRNSELSPILGEEDLTDSVSQAAFRAGIHFGLFDDLRAMLHVDTNLRALPLVHRMAHTQTAKCAFTLLRRSGNSSQWQRGKNHCENGEFRAPLH
jgi:hypothetical protein